MSIDLDRIKQDEKRRRIELIEEAKLLGLESITIEGVTYQLPNTSKTVVATPMDIKDVEKLTRELTLTEDVTAEEVLYYSSPYYDELQAKKEQREQAIKENPNG